jgi:glucans biosynthesis protein
MRGKAGNHPRNTGPMRASPRCGARTRKGTPCQSPAVSGKARCRMHGGASGSGAPIGNQNALKHGMYTKAALEEHKALRRMIREMQESLQEIEGG